jgi:hypothetical protein
MKIKAVFFVCLLAGYCYNRMLPVSKDDLYIKRLVYLKKDNSLFSGTLKIEDRASYSFVRFCGGFPCGEHAEQQNGGNYVTKGKYLVVQETLSEETLKKLSNDTVIIDYWQEGGDLLDDPYHLHVIVLKSDLFFKSDFNQEYDYILKLANSIYKDTKIKRYDYLEISFVNALYDWDKEYFQEYKVENQQLIIN